MLLSGVIAASEVYVQQDQVKLPSEAGFLALNLEPVAPVAIRATTKPDSALNLVPSRPARAASRTKSNTPDTTVQVKAFTDSPNPVPIPPIHSHTQVKSQTAENTGPAEAAGKGPAQSNVLFTQYPTWSQDFASDPGGQVNSKYWNITQGPPLANNEAEYYTSNPANIRINKNGLILEALKQKVNKKYDYTSARIDTEGKVDILYGKIDIEAEIPDGIGSWPAIWLYPANNTYADLSPPSDTSRQINGGEIDAVEAIGSSPHEVYGIVHTESSLSNKWGEGYFNDIKVKDNNAVFNDYSVEWTPSSITFLINNVPYYEYKKQNGADYRTWPFDKPFYFIANLALGGSWGSEDKAQYPPYGIDNAQLPATMRIKDINYYSYDGPVPSSSKKA